MRLDISDIVKLNGASMDITFNEKLPYLEDIAEDFTFDEPVNFKGVLVNMSGILKLDGELKVDYHVKCFRCLKDLELGLDIHIKEDFVDTRNNPDSEAYTYEGNYLEIDKVIKDNMVLNLPVRNVCNEDCKGLCSKCGTNLNTANCNCEEDALNPQMEALKNFFDK